MKILPWNGNTVIFWPNSLIKIMSVVTECGWHSLSDCAFFQIENKIEQFLMYRNGPKFSDTQVWANSVVLEEQSDQGLHCLPFLVHLLDALLCGRSTLFEPEEDYSKFFGCPNI